MIEDKKYMQSLSLVSSSKALFLLKGKVASTYVTRVLNNTYSIDVEVNTNNIKDYKIGLNYDETNDKDVRTLEYFKKFTENSLDKNVITFIRNPIERYLSGFVEDYIKGNLFIHNNIFLEKWLEGSKSKFDNNIIDSFVVRLVSIQQDYVTPNETLEEPEFVPIWTELISFLLNELLVSRYIYREVHRESWIPFVYILKQKKELNLSVYDIAVDNIRSVLEKYSVEKELKLNEIQMKHNKSTYFSEITESIYKKSKYIQRRLDDILHDEIVLYKELTKVKTL